MMGSTLRSMGEATARCAGGVFRRSQNRALMRGGRA